MNVEGVEVLQLGFNWRGSQGRFFPECVARVPVSFGGLGVRLCSRKVVSMSATVRSRLRVRRKALHSGECTWSDPESV